jgi:hypothetical protein
MQAMQETFKNQNNKQFHLWKTKKTIIIRNKELFFTE